MTIKGVLFDMDGVICHTNPYHSQAFEVFFQKRGIYPSQSEFEEHMYGKFNSYIFSHFMKRKIEGEELLLFEEEKEALFRSIYVEVVDPIPGFTDFLSHLKSSGIKTAVATSAPRANMDLILSKLDIEHLFESRLGSEDVVEHKPNPEVYLKSMQNLKLSPQECIVFEDSYSGISAGINAQCKVVGVMSSHNEKDLPPCDLFIEDYRGLSLPIIT